MRPWNGDPESWGLGEYRDVPVSKWVIAARRRHIRDLKRSLTDPDFPFYYDDEEAERIVWFFEEQLRHTKGRQFAGKLIKLEAWQELDVFRPLFGWKRKADGTRRFRRFFIFLPRKNTKSTLGAGLVLYMATGDGEPGAECYCAATKEKQARIVFDDCKRMGRRSPLLKEELAFKVKEIYCFETDSKIEPLGRDSDTEDGLNVHFGLIDEYHAHKTAEMLSVLDTATGARDQPLIGIITTAGFRLVCPCKDEYDYALRVVSGEIANDQYFVYVCTVDDPEKWTEPAEWYKANPQLGLSLSESYLAEKVQIALDQPSKKNEVLVKHLNIWTSGATAWMNMQKWDLCGGEIDWTAFKGRRCFGALDLGRTQDLSALALAFMGEDEVEETEEGLLILPPVYLMLKYWIPEDQELVEKSRNDEADYVSWHNQGFLELTPGPVTRTDIIRRDINKLREEFEIAEIAIDAWSATELAEKLDEDGVVVVKHRQSMAAMKFPVESLEDLVLSARLKHGDNPILKWNVSNAVAVRDGNDNIKLMKDQSKNRIDGAVASVMAVGRLLIAPSPVKVDFVVYAL